MPIIIIDQSKNNHLNLFKNIFITLMQTSPKQSNISIIRGVQKQIQTAFEQKKYSYCVQLTEHAIDLLKSNHSSSVTLANLEIDIRSFKAYLCYVHFNEREGEGEKEFKDAEVIDPLHPLLLRRKIESYYHRKYYNKALECCTDLLLNQPENTYIYDKKQQITSILLESQDKQSLQKSKADTNPSSSTLKVRFGSFEIIQFKDLQNDDISAENKNKTDEKLKKSKSILKDSTSLTSSISVSSQYITDEMKVKKKSHSFSIEKLKFIEKGYMEKKECLNDDGDDIDALEGEEKVKFKKQLSLHEKQVDDEKDDGQSLQQYQKVEKKQKKPTLKKSKSVAFRNQEYKE